MTAAYRRGCAVVATAAALLSFAVVAAAPPPPPSAAGPGAGPYQPTWASLDARPLPSWYDEAKVGIFLHWGVFSVPSWGTPNGGASGEWFWWQWQGAKNPAYIDFMEENYRPGFSYADFGPQMDASLWNATEWAQLFKDAGAKYVVLTSKHHEGWTNWPSATSFNWNSVDNGPHMDLVGNLTKAVRDENLTMGLYWSQFEWFHPLYLQDKANNYTTNLYPTQVSVPQLHEIVNKYTPDLIWSDGDWEADDTYWQSKEFLTWLYNESPVKDSIVVNDRWGSGDSCHHGGYFTCSDRYSPGKLQNHKWENAMTIDKWSWGFRRDMTLDDTLTLSDIITQLASTVSCGGNLLVNVGPRHDGVISPIFQERLLGMGAWLGTNGDAIYKTVPWRAQNESAVSTWYTQSADKSTVYAIALAWPAGGVLHLDEPRTAPTTSVTLLNGGHTLKWAAGSGSSGIDITMPPYSPELADVAWAVALTGVS